MAIKAGQIRKNTSQSYLTPISHSLTTFSSSGVGNTIFDDFAISGNFRGNNTYYVRVLINRININKNMGDTIGVSDNDPHNLNLDIKLYKDNSETSNYQTIGDPILIQPYFDENSSTSLQDEAAFIKWCDACIVDNNPSINDFTGAQDYYNIIKTLHSEKVSKEDGRQSNIIVPYQTIELVFTPYQNSQYLVFQLRRVTYDYTIEPRIISIVPSSGGISNRDISIVNNILPKNRANKIGIQTRPGSLIVINREPMRVGKSGILEINNGILITSVGIAAPEGEVNDFILDYIYTTT